MVAVRRGRGRVGVCLDIDGVLVRGKQPLAHARASLLRLASARVPFLLVTNGGGEPEPVKALALSRALGVRVHPEQLVLCSTPLRPVCAGLADRRVLVLGCKDVLGVARGYGLRRPVTTADVLAADPARFPFRATPRDAAAAAAAAAADAAGDAFAAAMVLYDPADYADLQVAMDVLRGGSPLGSGPGQAVPLYATNADVIFAGTHAVPRLAAGTFTVAFSALWREVMGAELRVTQLGKPSLETSAYAARQLARWAALLDAQRLDYAAWAPVASPAEPDLTPDAWRARAHEFPPDADGGGGGGGPTFRAIYMVGDNPRADVALAANAGAPWTYVLVRTGVFDSGAANDARHPADAVVDGIKDAVDLILADAAAD